MQATIGFDNIPQVDGHQDLEVSMNDSHLYTCETCDLTFQTEEEFEEHDLLQFYCNICLICFPTKKALNIHEYEFHPGFHSMDIIKEEDEEVVP